MDAAAHDRQPADLDTLWHPSGQLGGTANLCHQAVDRHAADRPDHIALVYAANKRCAERSLSYGQLHVEVQRMAAILQQLGVGQGDHVLLCMPPIPEAVIAMLATVRLGANHTVVLGHCSCPTLSGRIDAARPTAIVTADAGLQDGQVIAYKAMVDEALWQCAHTVAHVLLVNRGLAATWMHRPRDVDFHAARRAMLDARVPCAWGDTLQRDTGGCAVYAPLIAGLRTTLSESPSILTDAALLSSTVDDPLGESASSRPGARPSGPGARVTPPSGAPCPARGDRSRFASGDH